MSSKFYLGLDCVSRELIFGLREGDDFLSYLILGFALNSDS